MLFASIRYPSIPLRSIPSLSRRLLLAGPTTPPGPTDTDGDGVTDDYETTVGSDPNTPDADVDNDGDGATLLEEFLAGTLDNDPLSLLRITTVDPTPTGWIITWQSVPGKTYQLGGSPDLFTQFKSISGTSVTATSNTTSVSITPTTILDQYFFVVQVISNP